MQLKIRLLLLIFSASPPQFLFVMILFPFLFFSSLRIERAAGRWRDDDDDEELEEEVESAGQVDRVFSELEHQSIRQGLCTSICPSVHLPVCFVVHPFVHHPIFSLARRNLQYPHLCKIHQKILFSLTPSSPSQRGQSEGRGPGNGRI